MTGLIYYDRQGDPITRERAWTLLDGDEYRRIGSDHVGDLWISTVWLGIDHNLSGVGPPLIFETMIHDDGVDEWLDEQWRYATLEEARAGHETVVAALRNR